jgi:hypothetical protein
MVLQPGQELRREIGFYMQTNEAFKKVTSALFSRLKGEKVQSKHYLSKIRKKKN